MRMLILGLVVIASMVEPGLARARSLTERNGNLYFRRNTTSRQVLIERSTGWRYAGSAVDRFRTYLVYRKGKQFRTVCVSKSGAIHNRRRFSTTKVTLGFPRSGQVMLKVGRGRSRLCYSYSWNILARVNCNGKGTPPPTIRPPTTPPGSTPRYRKSRWPIQLTNGVLKVQGPGYGTWGKRWVRVATGVRWYRALGTTLGPVILYRTGRSRWSVAALHFNTGRRRVAKHFSRPASFVRRGRYGAIVVSGRRCYDVSWRGAPSTTCPAGARTVGRRAAARMKQKQAANRRRLAKRKQKAQRRQRKAARRRHLLAQRRRRFSRRRSRGATRHTSRRHRSSRRSRTRPRSATTSRRAAAARRHSAAARRKAASHRKAAAARRKAAAARRKAAAARRRAGAARRRR